MLTATPSDSIALPKAVELPFGIVNIWFVEIDRFGSVVQPLSGIISSDERERAERFHFERDRKRFVAARVFLRRILGKSLGVEPHCVSFQYGPFGKPALGEEFKDSPVRFNVSHSHGCAIYAVTLGREVGVDLEYIRPLDDLSALADRNFSVDENNGLRSLPAQDRLDGFFDCWTRKEAFLKATGDGLSFPLDKFDVSLLPGKGRRSLKLRGVPAEETTWTLISLEPHPAYAAALVVEGRESCHVARQWPAESILQSGARSVTGFGSTIRQDGWVSLGERPEDEIVA